MTIKEFVDKAQKQDGRNVFASYSGDLSNVPQELKEFYRDYNPVDVEVSIKDAAVRFFPVTQLDDAQKEYELGNSCFVFASSNGDPIYMENGKIASGVFGKNGFFPETLANAFSEYLGFID